MKLTIVPFRHCRVTYLRFLTANQYNHYADEAIIHQGNLNVNLVLFHMIFL